MPGGGPGTLPRTSRAPAAGLPPRAVEASGLARRDDARWSGALDIIPTKADYVLDLIRANSLWPLLSGLACGAFELVKDRRGHWPKQAFGPPVPAGV